MRANEIHPQERALETERVFKTMKASKAGSDSSSHERTQPAMLAGSFDDLFLEHWGRVYRLLVRLVGDPAEAEDLALETFLRLYQRPPASSDGSLGGWLHRVATNLGLTSIRSHRRREKYELKAGKGALEEALHTRPVEVQADEEERLLARTALARLNERQAQLLILRYSGLAYKEIAAILGLAPSSIGPLLVRAEREFEKQVRALNQEDV